MIANENHAGTAYVHDTGYITMIMLLSVFFSKDHTNVKRTQYYYLLYFFRVQNYWVVWNLNTYDEYINVPDLKPDFYLVFIRFLKNQLTVVDKVDNYRQEVKILFLST